MVKTATFIALSYGIICFSIIAFMLNIWLSPSPSLNLKQQALMVQYSGENDLDPVDMERKSQIPTDSSSALLIAAYPVSTDRLVSLWSQLECFVDKRFKTIVIAAPDWAKDDNILEPFLSRAAESIAHLKNVNIVIKYYVNDRYDVGLWCDSLYDENYKVFNEHDDFVLLNDSVLAIQHFTGVLDLLQTKNLSMTSLAYSDIPDSFYWLESFFRGFSKKGMRKYMKHACTKPRTHPSWCSNVNPGRQKRCIVDIFEVDIAGLFPRNEIDGLFSADVPAELIKDKAFEDYPTWASHWPYWTLLREKSFPVMKSSHEYWNLRAKRRGLTLNKCALHLEPIFLLPVEQKDTETSADLKHLIYPKSKSNSLS